ACVHIFDDRGESLAWLVRVRVTVIGPKTVDNIKAVLTDVQPGGAHARQLRARGTMRPEPDMLKEACRGAPGHPLYFDVAERTKETSTPDGLRPSNEFFWCYAGDDFPTRKPDGAYDITILVSGDDVPA